MQEQNGLSASRSGLRLIAGFILIAILLWLLIWLIFFRNTAKPTSSHGAATKKSQPTTTTTSSNGNDTGNNSGQLVNAGAGNVLVPFAVAGVAGGVLYQVRLRKRLDS